MAISGANKILTASGVFPVNTWAHIVGTYNLSTMILYVNGVGVGSLSFSGTMATPISTNYIGYLDGVGKLDGLIDNVRIYNRPLLAQEVQSLYINEYPEWTYPVWAESGAVVGTYIINPRRRRRMR